MFSWLFFLAILIVHTTAHPHRPLRSLRRQSKDWNVFSNRSAHQRDDHSELVKRDGSKYVFMHHVSYYSRTLQFWTENHVLDCWQWVINMSTLILRSHDSLHHHSDTWVISHPYSSPKSIIVAGIRSPLMTGSKTSNRYNPRECTHADFNLLIFCWSPFQGCSSIEYWFRRMAAEPSSECVQCCPTARHGFQVILVSWFHRNALQFEWHCLSR